MTNTTTTTTKKAHHLAVGDVIIAPDGTHHTVTDASYPGLSAVWFSFATNTGIRIELNQFDANASTYDVVKG